MIARKVGTLVLDNFTPAFSPAFYISKPGPAQGYNSPTELPVRCLGEISIWFGGPQIPDFKLRSLRF